MGQAADILEKRTDELVEYMKLETAATDYTARYNVTSAVAQLRQVASDTVAEAGFVPVSAEEGRSAMVIKEPYGVVMSIAAWYVSCGTARVWRILIISDWLISPRPGTLHISLVFERSRML